MRSPYLDEDVPSGLPLPILNAHQIVPKPETWSPDKLLLAAVLDDAMRTLTGEKSFSAYTFEEARRWLERKIVGHVFSAAAICAALGLDHSAVVAAVKPRYKRKPLPEFIPLSDTFRHRERLIKPARLILAGRSTKYVRKVCRISAWTTEKLRRELRPEEDRNEGRRKSWAS